MHNHRTNEARKENIKIAVFLNVFFTLVEFFGGLWTRSLAILSDALHDFGDSIVLILSYFLERYSSKPSDKKRTFGYGRLSIFAALFSGVVLFVGSLTIFIEAIKRLIVPVHVNSTGMFWLGLLGIGFNLAGFLRLKKGRSLNEKVLSWHLLEDVLGWVVIFLGSIIIAFFDFHRLDPIITLGYTVFILFGVVRNLREVFNVLLEGAPTGINLDEVKQEIENTPGVIQVHDLHIWSLDGEQNFITAHIVVEKDIKNFNLLKLKILETLAKYDILHSTFEFERGNGCGEGCN